MILCLGNRFVDGTRSMFVRPSPQFHTPSTITSSTSASTLPTSTPAPPPPPPAPKVLPPSVVVQQEVQKNYDPLSNPGRAIARASSTPIMEPPKQPEPVGPMGPLGPLGPLGPTPTHGNGPTMTQSVHRSTHLETRQRARSSRHGYTNLHGRVDEVATETEVGS
jgi:hypothetical protein